MGIGSIFGTLYGWFFNLIPYGEAKKWIAVYSDHDKTINEEAGKGTLLTGFLNLLIAILISTIFTMIFSTIANLLYFTILGAGVYGATFSLGTAVLGAVYQI